MPAIKDRGPKGVVIQDTIYPKRRVEVQLGTGIAKKEQSEKLRIYSQIVASLTPERRATIKGAELRKLIFALRDLPTKEVKEKAIGQMVAGPTTTVDAYKIARWHDLADEFLDWSKGAKAISDTQRKCHERRIENILTYLDSIGCKFYGDASHMTTAGYLTWRTAHRREADKRKNGDDVREVSAKVKRDEIQIWKRLVNYCIATKKFPDQQIFFGIEVTTTSENTKNVYPLSITEINAVFRSLRKYQNHRLHDLVLLAYLTGAELSGLEWIRQSDLACMDKETQIIKIFDMQVTGVGEGKTTTRGRDIPLCPTIETILSRGFIFGDYNLNSLVGNHLRKNRGYSFPKECPKWHMHQMRHSFATHKLQSGVAIETVSRWLGHKDIGTTINVYGRFAKLGIEAVKLAHKKHLDLYTSAYFTHDWKDE